MAFHSRFTHSSQTRRRGRPARRALMPAVELVEVRALLSTLWVTDSGDSGPGTLRAAILAADAESSPDTIDFNLGDGGHQVITLASGLPVLTNAITIDGTTQPGFAGTPLIEINGNGLTMHALELGAPDCVIKGLVINNITGAYDSGEAIFIDSTAPGFVIQGNYIGTDATGSFAVPVSQGIECYATAGLIGGTGTGQGNVLSGATSSSLDGHTGYAVQVQTNYTVAIQGNKIGTNEAGTAAIPNVVGIAVGVNPGADTEIIGGTTPGSGNLISGNTWGALGQFGNGGIFQGNLVGTDINGTAAIPNGTGLSHVDVVGGTSPGARNIISGNMQDGVGFSNVVQGNYIGTDISGGIALGNGNGVNDGYFSGHLIGGPTAAARNVIAGNLVSDIANLSGTVQGNFIGLDATGERSLDHRGQGFAAVFRPSGATIIDNVIATGDGMAIREPSNSIIQGNRIGTNQEGTAVIGNDTGIRIGNGAAVTIGGTATGQGNVISGNGWGIYLLGTGNSIVVQGNFIGTNEDGTARLGNGDGIHVDSGFAGGATIGGTVSGSGNVIAYNNTGVMLWSSPSAPYGVSILGNSIRDNLGGEILFFPPQGNLPAPVLTSATPGSTTTVTGSLTSSANTTFRIEFFASPGPDASGSPEGVRYLGFYNVTTDGTGYASINATGLGACGACEVITATATALTGSLAGSTSEFSNAVSSPPSSLSGLVFSDFNDDGQVDFGEQGIPGVAITLTGTDTCGNPLNLTQTTDADGTYVFLGIPSGTYTIIEAQPAGYTQGINTIGTGGGTVSGDQFTGISLAAGVNALNYNFGERPAATGPLQKGQTAGIGFWNNKNGQALIQALNGGTGHQLGDWLAATFPHLFGSLAGANNLAGKSNASIAALFQSDFVVHGTKLDAQVLATALAVYVTDGTLDDTGVGTQYGFLVGDNGVATSTYNVGSNGAAFGEANDTAMTVLDILLAADAQAVNGVLYNGDATRRNQANAVFSAINEAGGL